MFGKQVFGGRMHENEGSVEIGHLKNGLYHVRIQTPTQLKVVKMMKE